MANEAFDAEVFDHYGAIEVGRIYNECFEHNDYHTSAERLLVETIREGEKASIGEEGEITITNLDNYAMPFIRYNLGDLGILLGGVCSCGSCYPRMRLTAGRKKNMVELPDRRVVSVLAVIGVLNNIRGIRQFQIIHEDIGHFTVKMVKGRTFAEATIGEVGQELNPILGDVEVEAIVVDHISREKSGKFRPFITKVPTKHVSG